ncbi:unnamed protein product [Dracunculus medinensis]|uniref:BTB/POZ domain-containing protein n=1 Tax=Dracunculus medinensis TaxID=318479 RepID=A0A0N4UJ14_DRAME|nr:unnamed protein product [Dracunculus medinensis]
MISTSGSKIVRIPWKAAQVGTKSPREFQNCFTNSKDWISEEKTSYPLEIILMLIEYAKIYKIVIEAVDEHIPKKVDVLIEQTKSGERFTASALLHSRQIFHGRSFYQVVQSLHFCTKYRVLTLYLLVNMLNWI